MTSVEVVIVKLIDERFPGWVECELTDADGKIHLFREKIPVVEIYDDGEAEFPRSGNIRCKVLEELSEVVVIDTAWSDHVESVTGATRFSVSSTKVHVP